MGAAGAAGGGGMMGMMGGGSGMMSSGGNMMGSIMGLAYQKKVIGPYLKAMGVAEKKEIERQGREIGAKQMTGYTKAGVRTDVGTPVQVMADTAARSELAALRALFSYKMQIFEGQQQAKMRVASSMLMMGGSAAQGMGNLNWRGGGGYPSGAYSAESSRAAGLPYYGSDQPTTGGVYTMPSWLK